jgi:hypothetical protein
MVSGPSPDGPAGSRQTWRTSRFPRRKKIAFSVLTVLLGWLVIECFAWVLLYVSEGGMRSRSRALQGAMVSDIANIDVDPQFEVVHPYLGYVMHINNEKFSVQGEQPFSVTEYGFYDAAPPLRRRSPDRVVVGITGGSVANHFSSLSTDALAVALAPRFPGREIDFVRLALGGYKQPQQLMALNYMLALGGEFDIVINIDGFNEVVLPRTENVEQKVFAAFPRSWHLRVVAGNDVPVLRAIGYVRYCRDQRRQLAARFHPWRWSPTAVLIWHYRNLAIESRIADGLRAASAMAELDRSFCARGPAQRFASDQELYEHLADLWTHSSLQMHRLCAANGIEYYHFLQPTRHFPRVDPADRSGAADDNRVANEVQRGYPLLQQRGASLREQGVRFFDLTALIELREAPDLYTDCCHFNKAANDRMARRIAGTIVAPQAAADEG